MPGDGKKYYIWSRKHTKDYNCIFFGPHWSGYARDLNFAGIYSEEDMQKDVEHYPLITRENIREIKHSPGHSAFYIAVEDVELLGKKMICILN